MINSRFTQENSTRLNRVFVTCFNVTHAFGNSFKFWKARGISEFVIKYMEAAFDKEAGSGEFFFEFEEKVWEHKLIECFKSQGAGQVNTITFANNDGGDSASNALVRVLASQEKTNLKHSRGTCTPALRAKVQAKQALAKTRLSYKEFDEKTMAVMNQSMALQEETKAAVVKVEGLLEGSMETVNSVKDGMQSQAVKLESQSVKLDGIEHGVCNVIPDYQREIEQLKEALVKKTAACDTIEGKLGHKTRIINQQDSYIIKLEEGQRVDNEEKQAWMREKADLIAKNSFLQEQLNMSVLLKKMVEETQLTAKILSSTLEEERLIKRARGV